MSEPEWTVTVHGRTHHISNREYHAIQRGLERLRPPMQLVWELSGEDIRFPIAGEGVTFERVAV
jgi:hypothetical protein